LTKFLLLDSGPLGLLTHPRRSPEVLAISEWAKKASKLLPKRGTPDLQQLGAVLASLGMRLQVKEKRAA